jgi:hypothetical protein
MKKEKRSMRKEKYLELHSGITELFEKFAQFQHQNGK